MKINAINQDTFRLEGKQVTVEVTNGRMIIQGLSSKGSDFTIDSPGEYEAKGMSVFASDPGPVFQIELEGVVIVYTNHSNLTEEQKEVVERADVLLVNPKAKSVLPEVGLSEIEVVSEYQMKSARDLPEETVVIGGSNA